MSSYQSGGGSRSMRRRSEPINVDELGHWVTLVGSGALAVYGVTRRSWPGLVLGLLAGSVFMECRKGNCDMDLLSTGDYPQFSDRPADPRIEHSKVDEASWESFPASDPPSVARSTGF